MYWNTSSVFSIKTLKLKVYIFSWLSWKELIRSRDCYFLSCYFSWLSCSVLNFISFLRSWLSWRSFFISAFSLFDLKNKNTFGSKFAYFKFKFGVAKILEAATNQRRCNPAAIQIGAMPHNVRALSIQSSRQEHSGADRPPPPGKKFPD